MANEITKTSDNVEDLFNKVSGLIEQARSYVKTSVNTAEVYTKYYVGKYIVEYEQNGNVHAQYGKQVLQELSKSLTARFGTGWSYPNLRNIRQFDMLWFYQYCLSHNYNILKLLLLCWWDKRSRFNLFLRLIYFFLFSRSVIICLYCFLLSL